MSWSTPRTWSVGEVLTAANMNTYASNNLTYLKGGTSIDITVGAAWSLANGGILGAVAAARYVGATSSGNPGSGTFKKGDFVVSRTDHKVRVCTVAGSPGTWVAMDANPLSSVFGRSGVVVVVSSDYTAAKVTGACDKTYSAAFYTFAGGVQSSKFNQGIGYRTGAGGSVTQTGPTTSVTINKICGQIITNGNQTNVDTGSQVTFTVNNSCIDTNDTVILTGKDTDLANAHVEYWVSEIGLGYFKITYIYGGDTNLSIFGEGLVGTEYTFNFAVIKAVAA